MSSASIVRKPYTAVANKKPAKAAAKAHHAVGTWIASAPGLRCSAGRTIRGGKDQPAEAPASKPAGRACVNSGSKPKDVPASNLRTRPRPPTRPAARP